MDAVDAVAPEATQVGKALDAAIVNQSAIDADLSSSNKINAVPARSFWERFNPFSSSEPVTPPAIKVPEVSAAPVEEEASNTLEVPATRAATQLPEVVTAAPEIKPPAVAQVAAVEAPQAPVATNISRTPITLDTRPVITKAEPLPLPPPPAPLKAQDREFLAAAKPVLSKPEPIAASTLPAPLPVAPVSGSVQVEEAKRVPVTQESAPQTVPFAQAVPAINAAQTLSLSPSATEGQKAIWAQIGPFVSNEAALTYWANYRQNHPDFPVVRVRVTSPFQNLAQSSPQAWLRVGPVAQAGFVTNLCASLTPSTSLRCGFIRDLGTSSPLARTRGQQPTARYTR